MRRAAWLFVLALLAGTPALVRGQETPAAPTGTGAGAGAAVDAAGEAATEAADGEDGWNFEDEEEAEPTLAESAKAQALDLGLFTAFVIVAMTGFFLKNEKIKIATLVFAVIFLGFGRSQLYSVTNIFSMLTGNLPIFTHSLFWYFFATFTLASTVIWGRLYCGRVCAFGALTQLMDLVVPKKLRYTVPVKLEQKAAYIKYGLLVFVLAYYFITHDVYVYRYVEPFWMFSREGNWLMWTLLGLLLVATIFVRNLYCRFLCPVGAFLAVISQVTTVFRIKRWAECKTCKICEKTCEWGAIRGPQIVRSECVRCDDCERLYHDQQKCVHHIVIRRKADVLARQAAVAAAMPSQPV